MSLNVRQSAMQIGQPEFAERLARGTHRCVDLSLIGHTRCQRGPVEVRNRLTDLWGQAMNLTESGLHVLLWLNRLYVKSYLFPGGDPMRLGSAKGLEELVRKDTLLLEGVSPAGDWWASLVDERSFTQDVGVLGLSLNQP